MCLALTLTLTGVVSYNRKWRCNLERHLPLTDDTSIVIYSYIL